MDLGTRLAEWTPRAPKEGPDYTAAAERRLGRRGHCAGGRIASAWRFPAFPSFRTTMEFRRLGESGLEVSVICLGTMMFGDRTDAATAQRIVASAFDAGVNFIDTADVYAKGASETIVGPAIAANRRRWILATKVGNVMTAKPHDGGLSRRWIMQACEDSLQRLATDYIDIYYLHRDDTKTPLDETIEAMGELIRAGKIRYFGISNYRGWRAAEIVGICAELNVPRPVACQPYYNAFNRMPEVELLPACDYYGLGVVPYSPLARGVLTGKYIPGADAPAGSRVARKDSRMMETEFRPESIAMAQKIKAHAERKGLTATQFALAWVLNNRIISAVIAGPRTLEQWTAYLAAVGKTLDADDEALIDSLVAPGHPSTPGYNDPQYPFYGRIVD
jgi:aryl-alcohol dehydrogenase-like predicted oxidoreductase